jgi:hypothetical protein
VENGRVLVYCAGEEGSISAGPYYPFGTIGTVLRAYEGLEGRKIKIK